MRKAHIVSDGMSPETSRPVSSSCHVSVTFSSDTDFASYKDTLIARVRNTMYVGASLTCCSANLYKVSLTAAFVGDCCPFGLRYHARHLTSSCEPTDTVCEAIPKKQRIRMLLFWLQEEGNTVPVLSVLRNDNLRRSWTVFDVLSPILDSLR